MIFTGCADGSGGPTCCTSSQQCGEGEGDCDSDVDCAGNLKCGTDNCDTSLGFPSDYDCCYDPKGLTFSWIEKHMACLAVKGWNSFPVWFLQDVRMEVEDQVAAPAPSNVGKGREIATPMLTVLATWNAARAMVWMTTVILPLDFRLLMTVALTLQEVSNKKDLIILTTDF